MAGTVFDYALSVSSSDENGYGATSNKSWAELFVYMAQYAVEVDGRIFPIR